MDGPASDPGLPDRPTGRVVVRTPNVAAARAVLDGQVERQEGDRLWVRTADAAALNAHLTAAAVPVVELAPERPTLEEVVLRATAGSGDRVVR